MVAGLLPWVQAAHSFSLLAAAPLRMNAWGMLGLWGFLRSRPIGHRYLWAVCLTLTAIQFVAMLLPFVITAGSGGLEGREGAVSMLLAGSALLMLPLMCALWS